MNTESVAGVPTLTPDDDRPERLAPVTTPTLVESVAEAIRASILTGRFAPGDRLVEAELARELHVSRGPIREALGLLGKDGIVVHEPRRGKYVQPFTPKLIDEVYSLRRVLEPYAATLVIQRLDAAATDRLVAQLDAIARAAGDGDERRLAQVDFEFHNLLYELAGHELLRRAWLENIAGKLRLMSNVTTQSHKELVESEHNHRRLLEPILERDVETTKTRVAAHIDDAWARAKTEFSAMPGMGGDADAEADETDDADAA
jgi:DNA-binding GntR family transcriptional regulator